MKVLSSLKSAKKRDKNCRVVRRKGRLYVINKQNPRMKARQARLYSRLSRVHLVYSGHYILRFSKRFSNHD